MIPVDISRPASIDAFLGLYVTQWRGYLTIEIRAAQQAAKDHERAAQVEHQRVAALKAQLADLPPSL